MTREDAPRELGTRLAVGHGRPVILTELVVNRNDWARKLAGRPGVHVATEVPEIIEAVRGITVMENAVHRLVNGI